MSSLARNSAARIVVEIAGMVLGGIAAIVTARWLGASGKGTAATLTLLSLIAGRFASLGLGESGIVMVGRGIAGKADVIRANIGALLGSGLI